MQTETDAQIAALQSRIESLGELFDGLLRMVQSQTTLTATLNQRIAALEKAEAAAAIEDGSMARIDQLQDIARDQAATMAAIRDLCLASPTPFKARDFERLRLRKVAEFDQLIAGGE